MFCGFICSSFHMLKLSKIEIFIVGLTYCSYNTDWLHNLNCWCLDSAAAKQHRNDRQNQNNGAKYTSDNDAGKCTLSHDMKTTDSKWIIRSLQEVSSETDMSYAFFLVNQKRARRARRSKFDISFTWYRLQSLQH